MVRSLEYTADLWVCHSDVPSEYERESLRAIIKLRNQMQWETVHLFVCLFVCLEVGISTDKIVEFLKRSYTKRKTREERKEESN